MSLLTVGQTLWDLTEQELYHMIGKILGELKEAKLIKSYMRDAVIQELTLDKMISQIRSRWAHKIDQKMEEYLETFDSKSRVVGVNIESWGWVYYIQDKDGHWNFVFDKHHHLCREFSIKDFEYWVKDYGSEFAQILTEEIGIILNQENPFESVPITTSTISFERKGDLVEAVIELEENQ